MPSWARRFSYRPSKRRLIQCSFHKWRQTINTESKLRLNLHYNRITSHLFRYVTGIIVYDPLLFLLIQILRNVNSNVTKSPSESVRSCVWNFINYSPLYIFAAWLYMLSSSERNPPSIALDLTGYCNQPWWSWYQKIVVQRFVVHLYETLRVCVCVRVCVRACVWLCAYLGAVIRVLFLLTLSQVSPTLGPHFHIVFVRDASHGRHLLFAEYLIAISKDTHTQGNRQVKKRGFRSILKSKRSKTKLNPSCLSSTRHKMWCILSLSLSGGV